MGCMVRSERMSFCEMYLQPEAAFYIISELGEIGRVQFQDMTPRLKSYERSYITEVCRYAEIERILRFLEMELRKDHLEIPPFTGKEPSAYTIEELNELETFMDVKELDLTEIANYQVQLLQNLQQMQELLYLLKNIDPIIGDAELQREAIMGKGKTKAAGGGDTGGGKLNVTTGVVPRSKAYAFETMLFRISRGNIFFRPAAMDQLFTDPQSGAQVRKVAFVAVCQGEHLKGIVDKICVGFHVNIHECPTTYSERGQLTINLQERISDLDKVIRKSKYHRCKQLRVLSREWWYHHIRVKKAKAIYSTLNLFSKDISKKCIIGQGWIPTIDVPRVQAIFREGSTNSGSEVSSFLVVLDTLEEPPTYHRLNKFTRGFQALVGAYGDSIYRELNPGLHTLITFPFLFSIMFGDFGHGIIMLIFAVWMVKNEKEFSKQRSKNDIWKIFYGGRYVILSMAISTLYTGFIYNDVFSKPFRLKDNYWCNTFSKQTLDLKSKDTLTLDPKLATKSWYMIGVDPTWAGAKNKIMTENSLKMKLSLIVGIVHMMFGLWLSLFNHIYFGKKYAIFLEFIPQTVFLTCLFLWLAFLIIYKWIMYGPREDDIKKQPGCAPLILILFIDMCLFRTTKVEDSSSCDAYMFQGQESIQKILVLFALVNVPIMLFGSPLYLLSKNKKMKAQYVEKLKKYIANRGVDPDPEDIDKTEQALVQKILHYSESFADMMLHQGVHTIEYVLSTVSHTASYLRLWALSLAHAQLSEMLWGMILSKLALKDHSTVVGPIKVFIIFTVWAVFSISILVIMEGLSAFLHTLRLHWVEFMSKFFMGGGKIFSPFSFEEILYGDVKEEKEGACPEIRKAY